MSGNAPEKQITRTGPGRARTPITNTRADPPMRIIEAVSPFTAQVPDSYKGGSPFRENGRTRGKGQAAEDTRLVETNRSPDPSHYRRISIVGYRKVVDWSK